MKIIFKFKYLFWILMILITNISSAESNETTTLKATPVTTTKVAQTTLLETTLVRGEIESPNTPHVAAKVAAEVVSTMVDDGIPVKTGQLLARLDDQAFRINEAKASANQQRLVALIENQQRRVKRSNALFSKKLLSRSDKDDVSSIMKQLQAELLGAESMLEEARYQLSHTRIISPVNGFIQQRLVSKGDYVKAGALMFHVVSMDQLRARIYFPDTLGSLIHSGMQVKLTKGKQTVIGTITSIRPMMEAGNRALHALVKFDNNNNWKPGTSITAHTVLAEHTEAVVVPAKSLVRRPAGIVLYRLRGNKVTEQVVTTGLRQGNLVEITSGIKVGDTIVLDGAAWLTDGATVDIQEKRQRK